MAANTTPIFGLTANVTKVRVTTANTTRDLSVTTNSVLSFTAGTNGSRVERITFTHVAANQTTASVAAVVRIYITNTAITDPILYKEIGIALATPSSTAIGATTQLVIPGGIFIPSGQFMYVTTSATTTWDVVTEGYDY